MRRPLSHGTIALIVLTMFMTACGGYLLRSVAQSRTRASALAQLETACNDLLDALVELNRPGNDVLGSQDVGAERGNFRYANAAYTVARSTLAYKIDAVSGGDTTGAADFSKPLEALDSEAKTMRTNAEGVFSALERAAALEDGGDHSQEVVRYKTIAGVAMARMDHGFTLAVNAIRGIEDRTSRMLVGELASQRVATSELTAAVAIIPIIICVSLYLSWRNQRRLEEKFNKRLRFTQFSIDRVADSIFWTTPDGKIVSVNDAACRSLGYSRDELVSMSIRDIDTSLSVQLWESRWSELQRQESSSFETCYRAKDGTLVPVEARANHLDFDGMEYSCTFVYDVTARRQTEAETAKLEAELRQVHKMEAVGSLAGGIAHDFNNILGAIIGSAELALDDTAEGTLSRDNVQRILDAGLRARDLVKQILTFSRQADSERAPVRVSSIVSEALDLVNASLPAMVEIRTDIDGSSGTVYGDSTEIHQLVMNLCANAGHAIGDTGGVLEVSVCDLYVDTEFATSNNHLKPGPYVRLSVSDTGGGMDAATQERIFEPFFTTKDVDEGTGMGLAVVHGIVMEHGGAIAVDSSEGRGARFDIYLPQCTEMVANDPPERAPARMNGSESVLLVDDEPPLVEMARQLLERLGYHVTAFTSSEEAVHTFRAQPYGFDIVITDHAMPHMSGSELVKELRAIRSDIPVLVTTGYSRLVTAENARAKGFSGYVGKPYSVQDLALAVRNALDGTDAAVDIRAQA